MANEERKMTIADYEEVLADHRRLVRELDVLLNGAAGAAKQASLCDIVAQLKAESVSRPDLEALDKLLSQLERQSAEGDCQAALKTHAKILAFFPASTVGAQTGWVSVEERLPVSDEHNDQKEFIQVAWKREWWGRKLSTDPEDNSVASPCGIDTCFIPYFVARHYHQATHWQPLPAPPAPAAQPEEEKSQQ